MNKLLCSLLMFASASAALAQECKRRPEVIGACYVIHGRAEFGNGTPSLRIWRAGTKHKYGVFPDDPTVAPQNLLDALHNFDYSVYGDYEVCPYTREKKGSMTMVCIESAKNLVVTEYGTATPVGERSH